MKQLNLLGSTGSIGTQTLEVVRRHPQEFSVISMTCGHNIELFRKQLAEFKPEFAVVCEEKDARVLKDEFPQIEFAFGIDGICLAAKAEGELTVNGLLGMMGIKPTYEAIMAGKDIAFANKETLVAGGDLIMAAAKKKAVKFLPVDSEHSAIFQSLQGAADNRIRRIILTASGGPFRGYSAEEMKHVTKAQALNHPRWSMGAKITIDSATMMNKGLEIIEASHLFGVPASKIEAVVHPQSVLHSAVEFEDGCIIGQMGCPDMKAPIAYALSYPNRLDNIAESLNFFDIAKLEFEKPDLDVFRCLKLAYKAIEAGGTYTEVLNASNEEAVAAFLNDQISFVQIADVVEEALGAWDGRKADTVEDILEYEKIIREKTRKYITIADGSHRPA